MTVVNLELEELIKEANRLELSILEGYMGHDLPREEIVNRYHALLDQILEIKPDAHLSPTVELWNGKPRIALANFITYEEKLRRDNERAYLDALQVMADDQIEESRKKNEASGDTEFAIKTPGMPHRSATEEEVVNMLSSLAKPGFFNAGQVDSPDGMGYKRVYTTVDQNPDYVTLLVADPKKHGMAILRKIFPNGEADPYNLVLFSTDGIHGGCMSIEGYMAERDPEEKENGITFSYIQPRLSQIRIGQCYPVTTDDFVFLMRLRQSSWGILSDIGRDEEVTMRKNIDSLITGHIDHQILVSGYLANQEEWCAVYEALASQYERDRERLEVGVLADKAEVIRFLRTAELLHRIDPQYYEEQCDLVKFDKDGKASLVK